MHSEPRSCRSSASISNLLALLALLLPVSLTAQEVPETAPSEPEPQQSADPWSIEDLRERSEGLHAPGLPARLEAVGELVAEQRDAFAVICVMIQGDHREYQLRIEKLLDQLADDRWLSREDAERSLVEIGGRALNQIEARKQDGETLEERIRCGRILEAIAARGTEAEEAEVRLLRGLTLAAAYMRADPRLVAALRSALDHSDAIVRENAARALGAIGGDADAERLSALASESAADSSMRRAALAGLARLQGSAGPVAARALLLEPDCLSQADRAALLRGLTDRDDAALLLEQIGAVEDAALTEMLRCAAASVAGDAGIAATPDLGEADDPVVELQSIGCDALQVTGLVDSLDRVDLPLIDSHRLRLRELPTEVESQRLFLTQGSLLCGTLLGIDAEQVRFESPWFGEVALPRSVVQGLALDPSLDRMVGASDQHDRVRLIEGGALVDGQIEVLQEDALQLRLADGELSEIPVEQVAGLLFRRTRPVGQDLGAYTRIDTGAGDRLLVHLVASGAEALAAVLPGVGCASLSWSEIARLEFEVGGGALWGFTLIADYSENRIVEVDESGKEVFSLDEVYGAWDAECLDNGNLLVTEFALNRVIEVTRAGEEVWVYDKLRNPYDADRLANGNTLIADTFGDRVVEVNPAGEEVWKLEGKIRKPYDADRLANGNTLVADGGNSRVVEFDPAGLVVWEIRDLENVHDADRLPNGNTLITQRTVHRVIEVDRDGDIVFALEGLSSPSDADRLPNGHTLVAENGWVREFDRRGEVVWAHEVAWAVEVNRY